MKPMYQEQVVQAMTQQRRTSENKRVQREARATPPADTGATDPRNLSGHELGQERSNDSGPRLYDASSGTRLASPSEQPSPSPQRPPFHSTPSGELFPPTKSVTPPKMDGPPRSRAIRATNSVGNLSKYGEAGEESGCFSGLFKRRKGEMVTPSAEKAAIARPKTTKEDRTMRPGGGGIVPGIDAPVSAINAGDRQVLMECAKSKMIFPVTPETTSVDLIKSAATCMSERIDIKSAILLEYFHTVGVERPIRRYERIRDVMNSWDHDRQNSLILIDPGTGSVETELTTAGVPKQKPGDQIWFLHYSQKPGKWDKRYVALREDGQMTQSKEPNAQAKDATNICHLSDFDIYTPTKEKARKKFRPPQAQCYAIKSQQKTSVFESAQDYVHLFSSGDPQTADNFHNAVQAWRSWYLVNMKGVGQKDQEKAKQSAGDSRVVSSDQAKAHQVKGSVDSHYQIGSFKPLMDPSAFDQSRNVSEQDGHGFAKSSNQFDVNVSPERRTSTAKRQHPPVALNKRSLLADSEPVGNLVRNASVNKRRSSTDHKSPESAEYKKDASLGRNYSQRRRDNDTSEAQQQQPFTVGSLGAGDGMRGQNSVQKPTTSAGEVKRWTSTRDNGRNRGHVRGGSVDLQRSGSRREKPKPLVDLTPQYREPLQHSKKGKGYNPNVIGAGGLIESATSPEDPLNIPSQTIFRNTSGQCGGQSSPGLVDLTPQHREPVHHARKGKGYQAEPGSSGLVGHATAPEDPLGLPQNNVFRNVTAMPEGRLPSGSAQHTQPTHRRLSFSNTDDGFTSGGLLAQEENRQGQGAATKGRGVVDGSRAGGKPLIDLSESGTFAKGSLLNSVERAQGGPIPAPVIDRSRREEKGVKYGEGY
ncbi:hypothetical protein DOTSEDRAFT_72533 [Dothistroma septosporum NZE10]|uniref:PH domain-containing protein n=1 Tax=Dothistroma septosporum (strain NZE10 / CBS 128990) TaxID=675120 RepID=M2Y4G2_DOTSN|nr:hypothetical protein DOTSEDRAFT_72533 [Dothistroma septosporum NZE10]